MLFIEPYLLRGSTLGWVASTLAIAFALRGMIGAVFTRPAYVFPDPFHFEDLGRNGIVTIAGASVQIRSFFVIGLAAGLAALAAWTLERTRHGRALQAIASDPEAARFVGLPVETLVALTFGLVGGLAAIAAVAAAPSAPFTVDSGALLGLKGLVAALIVRFGSPWAAFAAGLGVGLAEAAIDNMGGVGLGPQYGELIPLAFALGRNRVPLASLGARPEPGMNAAQGVLGQTRLELAAAAREARSAWSWTATLWVLAFAAAALVPLVLAEGRMADLAGFVYLALAAVGLGYAVGLAGIPSLGQGAFLGIGAFTEALLRAKWGWPLLPSLVVAIGVTAAAECSPESRPAGCGARSSPSAPGS